MIKKPVIVIIDYGMGNIRSVMNKIHKAGHEAIVSHDHDTIKGADRLILPGVAIS